MHLHQLLILVFATTTAAFSDRHYPSSLVRSTPTKRMAAAAQILSTPKKIVICGAGLHGSSLAYYLTKAGHPDVTVIERHSVAAAASGKGGGFLARDWGKQAFFFPSPDNTEIH